MDVWEIILLIFGITGTSATGITGIRALYRHLRDAKGSVDANFERKTIKVIKPLFEEMIKPVYDKLDSIQMSVDKNTKAERDSLKQKLRDMYKDVFEIEGNLEGHLKQQWDLYYSHYRDLGGNGDMVAMNEEVQRVCAAIKLQVHQDKYGKKKGIKANSKIINKVETESSNESKSPKE